MLYKLLTNNTDTGFQWIDLVNPGPEELQQLTLDYKLHAFQVADCMQADHLPKYEADEDKVFIILRFYDTRADEKADTIQELTNKLAVFYGDNFLITIHREELPFVTHISENIPRNTHGVSPLRYVLHKLTKAVLLSFQPPANQLTAELDAYESLIFLHKNTKFSMEGLYLLRRKADVIRRLLVFTGEAVDNLDVDNTQTPYTRDTRDEYLRLSNIYDILNHSVIHLVNVYFSMAAQRTNETMRILTVFSVFFMPVTFIVGVYGMNFRNMPELSLSWGYPAVLLLMVGVTLMTYLWFKRKGWI